MPSLTNPWVLTMLAILSVVFIAMILRVTHRIRHGKTPTTFTPLPSTQTHAASKRSMQQHSVSNGDEDPLLAKGA